MCRWRPAIQGFCRVSNTFNVQWLFSHNSLCGVSGWNPLSLHSCRWSWPLRFDVNVTYSWMYNKIWASNRDWIDRMAWPDYHELHLIFLQRKYVQTERARVRCNWRGHWWYCTPPGHLGILGISIHASNLSSLTLFSFVSICRGIFWRAIWHFWCDKDFSKVAVSQNCALFCKKVRE